MGELLGEEVLDPLEIPKSFSNGCDSPSLDSTIPNQHGPSKLINRANNT